MAPRVRHEGDGVARHACIDRLINWHPRFLLVQFFRPATLGGRLFEPDFCEDHAGMGLTCTSSGDCSIRSLWQAVQQMVDRVLGQTT